MADRIVVLNEGRVEQLGSPLELYQNPATLFVAGFIGAPRMNFLDVAVKEAADRRLAVVFSNGAIWTMPAPAESLKTGDRLKLGIRPEHVALDQHGELQGEIDALEHLGPRTYVHARLTDGTPLVVETGGETSVREGDRLAFRIHAPAAHLFDGSGRALTRLDAAADGV